MGIENIKIVGRNIKIDDTIHDFIMRKISKIDRYIPKIISLEIVLHYQKFFYEVSVVLHTYNKKIVKLSCKEKKLTSAINTIVDKIKESLVKLKEKTIVTKKKHSGSQKYELMPKTTEMLVKTTTVAKKMSEKEAIAEAKKQQGDYFTVFFNTSTNKLSMISKHGENIIISDIET